jgi:alpha-1,2-mannosyltransferase
LSAVSHIGLGRARMVSTVVLVAVAGMFLVTLVAASGSGRLAADFQASYLDAAQSIRSIGTPYTPGAELPYVYPPVLAELIVPLTFLPDDVASFLAFLGSLAAVMGALALVGVRDVRCYAAVVIWAPGWNSFEMANVTSALTLLAALAWRYRDRAWPAAGALGLALSVKLFLWPLLVWSVATRRVRTAFLALGLGVVIALASWAVIGFAGFTSYPDQLGEVEFANSYSFVGMASDLGLDPLVGRLAMVVVGGALLVGVGYLGQRADDVRSFACAVVAALALSPVVWLHYLVLLVVPLGIARPRFAPIWLVPIVLWICPRASNGDGVQPFIPAIVVAVMLIALLASPGVARRSAESPA